MTTDPHEFTMPIRVLSDTGPPSLGPPDFYTGPPDFYPGPPLFNGPQKINFKVTGPELGSAGPEKLVFTFPDFVYPNCLPLEVFMRSATVSFPKEDFIQAFNEIIQAHETYKGTRIVRLVGSGKETMIMDIREVLVGPEAVITFLIPDVLQVEIVVNTVLSYIDPAFVLDWKSKVRSDAYKSLRMSLPEDYTEPAPNEKVPPPEGLIRFVPPWQSIPYFDPLDDTDTELRCMNLFMPFSPPRIIPKYTGTKECEYLCTVEIWASELYEKIANRIGASPNTIYIVNEWFESVVPYSPDKVSITGILHVFSTLPVEGGIIDTWAWAKENIIDANMDILNFRPGKMVLQALEFKTTYQYGEFKGRRIVGLEPNGFPCVYLPREVADPSRIGCSENCLAILARMMGRVPSKQSVQLPTAGRGLASADPLSGGGSSGGGGGSSGGGRRPALHLLEGEFTRLFGITGELENFYSEPDWTPSAYFWVPIPGFEPPKMDPM